MRITARQIELFQMAYRHRSTRRAADALNITQPAISRAITELELEIGVQLFDRAGRKFEPTAAAHSLNKAVQRHYQGLDRVLEAAEKISSGTGGLIRIATVPAVADTRIAVASGRLMARYPDLRFDVDVLGEQASVSALREGRVDCAIISSDPGDPGLHAVRLADLKPVAILPGNDPFAGGNNITPEELAEVAQVMLPPDSPSRDAVERMFDDARTSFQVRAEARTQSALIWMVAQGAGRAIVDKAALHATPGADVRELTLKARLRWPIRVITTSATRDAPGLVRLTEELQKSGSHS